MTASPAPPRPANLNLRGPQPAPPNAPTTRPALPRLAELLERSEMWLLGLAAVAIGIYLADLRGVWADLGLAHAYAVTMVVIDALFVVDLVLKLIALRGPYLRSPWCLIDVLSAIPLLASLQVFPNFIESLRFFRGVRLFRMLRVLRALRVMRELRLLGGGQPPPASSPERKRFERTVFIAVLVYAVLFIGTQLILETSDRALANAMEFTFVLGSLLGMGLVVVIARSQFPAIAQHQVRALLNVALPNQVAAHFLEHPEQYDRTVRAPATVIFCDLQGFTTIVEQLGDDLDALKHHLESAMDVVVRTHRRYDLIVDKFIGDAIMSFRGGNLVSGDPAEHAWRVVRATLEAREALVALADPYFHKMRVGGASSTGALIGTFGTSTRLSYTILGDRVNLAARLEAASGPLGCANLFCDLTYALTADRTDLRWRRVGGLRAQGKREVIMTYEAHDAATTPSQWIDLFHAALKQYEAGEFDAARFGFERAETARAEADHDGGDPLSAFYRERCAEHLADPPGPDWQPHLAPKK